MANVRLYGVRLGKYLLFSVFLFLRLFVYGQQSTVVQGKVVDAITKEPLPFVNISFKGTAQGTVTDLNGKFYLDSEKSTDTLKISYVGYQPRFIKIQKNTNQRLSIVLQPEDIELEEVVVKGEKLRYRNKGNPAVKLIRKVIDHRDENRKEDLEYFEYDKYEKVEFDLNNISEKFLRKNKKKYDKLLQYIDTSEINGKPYIPLYLRESSSKVYYRKDPQTTKEYRDGVKMIGFDYYIDEQGLSFLIDKMYQQIDIYDNNIDILTQKFVSPISTFATSTYKYYIADTLEMEGGKFIKLSFEPRNKTSLAFSGNLYITTDSSYAVKKAYLRINSATNINFVEDLVVEQDFKYFEGQNWMLTKDKVVVDFSFFGKKGTGLFGKRTVSYEDYVFNQPRSEDVYSGFQKVIEADQARDRKQEFWENARHEPLSEEEEEIYVMVEEVKELPAFKRTMNLLLLVVAGYKKIGPFEIGPVNTFYSFNQVEGFRVRLGGRTNTDFDKNLQFETYGAYGFRDERFKYALIGSYFFRRRPQHVLRFTRQKEVNNPGEKLEFVMEDNFLLSFKRGDTDRMFYNSRYIVDYIQEFNGFSYELGFTRLKRSPGGILTFQNQLSDRPTDGRVRASMLNLKVRFAPNEQYYQGKQFRIPIINKYPIFSAEYTRSIEDFIGADYDFDKLTFSFFKRFYASPIGYSDLEFTATKIWGTLPYPLLSIPRANQTFSFQLFSYNLMNFMEFVSDRNFSFNYAHYFNGYIMNKLPLIKKLKLRSIITLKGLLGDIRDENLPENNPELFPFPVDEDGNQVTFPLTSKPYLETSLGIANIFKFFRVDVVKRLTYLDLINVPENVQLRARFKVEF